MPAGVDFRRALARSAAAHARWPDRGQENRLEPECWPVIQPTFQLSQADPVFTVGSCFARNIERHLAEAGFDVPAVRLVREYGWDEESFNKYTPPSIYQELRWARTIFDRDDTVRSADIENLLYALPNGRVIDLQRHGNSRSGVSAGEALEIRRIRYGLFRQAFICPVAVITLGLIECWWDAATGDAVELHGSFKDAGERFLFRRLEYNEALDYTNKTLDLLLGGSTKHVLITTSPVPLQRTFTEDDVIVANSFSKSMLRVVSGQVAAERPEVDYFPSYESVTLTREPSIWLSDLVHVAPTFVGRIMSRVMDNYARAPADDGADDRLAFIGLVVAQNWERAGELFARFSGGAPPAGKPTDRFLLSLIEYLLHIGQREEAKASAKLISPRQANLSDDEMIRLYRAFDALGLKARARVARERGLRPPKTFNRLHVRVHFLLLAGYREDARLLLETSMSKFSDQADGLVVIGDAWAALGEREAARKAFREASRLAPNDPVPPAKLRRLDA